MGVRCICTWDGHEIDLLAGESFQGHSEDDRLPCSGLAHHGSDSVAGGRVAASRCSDFTARMRLNPYTRQFDFGDALFSAGVPHFHIRGGYVWEPVTPYYYYATDYRTYSPPSLYFERVSELSGGFSADYAGWHLSGFTRRSLSRAQFVTLGGDTGYSNDCFGIDFMYFKQYTSIGGEQRNSTYLVTVSLKTLGSFGLK